MTLKQKAVTVVMVTMIGPGLLGIICKAIWHSATSFAAGMLLGIAVLGLILMWEPAKLIDWMDLDLQRPALIPFEEYQRTVWEWPNGTPRLCSLKSLAVGQTCIERKAVILCNACAATSDCLADYEKYAEEVCTGLR